MKNRAFHIASSMWRIIVVVLSKQATKKFWCPVTAERMGVLAFGETINVDPRHINRWQAIHDPVGQHIPNARTIQNAQ